jgi:DNA-binding transcriptional ArsR family regulator
MSYAGAVPPADVPPQTASPSALKALANPLRQKILRELRLRGEATSTTLARAIGVTSGGTSYNLRILARHGLVEEVPERARGRERWWRATRHDLRLTPGGTAETGELLGLWLADDIQALTQLAAGVTSGALTEALPYSRGTIQVTPTELAAFFDEYIELLKRYQRAPGDLPPGARTIFTRFIALPQEGPP